MTVFRRLSFILLSFVFLIESGAHIYAGGVDFTESIVKENAADKFLAGDIVGIRNGKVVRSTQVSDQYLVIAQKAGVMANPSTKSLQADAELVNFAGQVYVKIRQSVKSGQYIVASSTEPGLGVSKSLAELKDSDIPRIVGRAWETSSSNALRNVKVSLASVVVPQIKQDLQPQLDGFSSTIKSLQASNEEAIKNLRFEMDSLKIEFKAMRDFMKPATTSSTEVVNP